MSRLASATDFIDGPMYTGYTRYPFFSERAQRFLSTFTPPANWKILVAGCGFGYLVDELVARGVNAYGCDASSWAIAQGQAALPAIAARLTVGDLLTASSMRSVRVFAGIANNSSFNYSVSEDVLPVAATDAEAQTMLTNLRAVTAGRLHILTCGAPQDTWRNQSIGLLWHTEAQWRTLIAAPSEPCWDTETGAQF